MKSLSIFISCLICSFIVSCNKSKTYDESNAYAASIDGEIILLSKIDSMVQKDIYNIRKWQLDILLSDNVFKKEAERRKISKDSLLFLEVVSKAKEPEIEEINSFMAKNQNFTGTVTNAKQILYDIFKQERYERFTDSLRYNIDVTIFLLPAYSKFINTTELWGINMNTSKSNTDIYFIMNFECPSCLDAYKTLKNNVAKYNKQANFKLIYLNGAYGIEGEALMAFNEQGKSLNLLDEIIANPEALYTDKLYEKVIEKLNLSKSKFEQDIRNEQVLRNLLQTRDALFKQGVYSTPSIIINGKLYEGEEIFEHLEQLIQSETSTYSK